MTLTAILEIPIRNWNTEPLTPWQKSLYNIRNTYKELKLFIFVLNTAVTSVY